MRKVLIVIAVVGGLASIALCASYGWDQATVIKDQVTAAFIYGMVAVFALVLHVVAIRSWVSGWRKCGVAIGVAGFLAFVMTAFTSLGGLASRSDRVMAERQDVIDSKADTKQQIADLTKEKLALHFTRTLQAGVDAAELFVTTAKQARVAECGNGDPKQRGRFCRDKEDVERDAVKAFAEAQQNKGATDRFEEIENEVKRLRLLKGEGSVGSVDPLRTLLSAIMGKWAELLTAWQKAVFAVIYDVCMIAVMVGIEVLGHAKAEVSNRRPLAPAVPPLGTPELRLIEASPRQRSRGRLGTMAKLSSPSGGAEEEEVDPTPVIELLKARVPKAVGEEADWDQIYAMLPDWWRAQRAQVPILTREQFVAVMKFIGDEAGIRVRKRDGKVFFIDRKVVSS